MTTREHTCKRKRLREWDKYEQRRSGEDRRRRGDSWCRWRVAICSRWLPYRALRLPLYSPLACKPTLSSVAPHPRVISPILSPISARSSHRSLPPSNLSTSGQSHLLTCPQDINRIQRLVSVYTRAHIYRLTRHLVCTLMCMSIDDVIARFSAAWPGRCKM